MKMGQSRLLTGYKRESQVLQYFVYYYDEKTNRSKSLCLLKVGLDVNNKLS